MSAETQILLGFSERMDTFSHSPMPEIIPPNRAKPTPNDGMWIELGLFPGKPNSFGPSFDSPNETVGFCQALICFRKDIGQFEPSRLADAVISHFPKGTPLGPVRVVQTPYQMPAVTEDGSRMYIAVTIPYHGLTCDDG